LVERAGVTYLAATPTVWQLLVDAGWRGRDDFVAVTGGEAFGEDLANALASRSAGLWTGYGPTEASVYATLERFEQGGRVTIGRPVANTRTYVLDRFRHPVPVGVPGELYIAGIGVSEGYVNRPEETASRFSEDPFRPGGRMYRTGDLVRQLADGRFEYLSRLDDQVKLRGFRIELGEIESTLRAHPGVASAVVRKLDDGSPAGARLVAYVVPRASMPSSRELRQQLRSSLPEHMVPSAFVELAQLPSTPNGKLDEGRLPAAFSRPTPSSPAPSGEGSSLTRVPLEDQLLGIWREVLGVDHVGLDDDFFEVGGHSLLALRLVALASTRLGVEISVSSLSERGGTVRAMAAAIEEAAGRGESTLVPDREQSRPSTRNLFFVVPWEPPLVALRHLRPMLAPEHSVVGLLAGHRGEPFDSAKGVEERAASMLSLILRIQDEGPYLLAGFSFGGLIAYEVATQLTQAGQHVAWLGLVNTWAGSAAAKRSNAPVKLARALALGPRTAAAAVRRHARHPSSMPQGDELDLTGGFDVAGAAALRGGYAPRPNGLTLDLFVSERDAISHGRTLGWNRSHSDLLRLHVIPGDHRVLLDASNAGVLAREIRQSLDAIR
jgi:thioesterase domain-containing protein/acyl carrier protein